MPSFNRFKAKIKETFKGFFFSSPLDLKKERKAIFILTFSLSLLGLLFIYESSSFFAHSHYGDSAYFFKRQSAFLVLSLFCFFGALIVDLNFLRRHCRKIIFALFFLLAAVLLFSQRIGGARRWFTLGIINVQPSELLKIFFLIYCADYCSRKKLLLKNFYRGLLPLLLVLALSCLLLLAQPDLGSVIFWVIWFLIFVYLFGARLKHVLLLILSGFLAGVFLIIRYPYRVRRIAAYFNPFSDPLDSGFQLIQSQLAYGRGGFFGVGMGEGRQKLFFLPAAHTDFIFSIIAEELGLIAVLGLLFVFFLIIHKMFKIARFSDDQFRKGVLIGITIILFLEVFFNIGVSCGLIPTKGTPLPFVSYGGTSLVVHFFLLGLFFNASCKQKEKTYF